MKRTLLLLVMWQICCFHALCQSEESRVVDAVSGEPLPYAGVYVSPELGTMTNDDGFFRLDVAPGQPIRISYVGYEKLQTTWKAEAQTFRLKPLATEMHEVTVVSADEVLMTMLRKQEKEYRSKRNREANYFYRLTNTFSGKTEMAEAFVKAKSAINVRDMEFYNARSVRQTRYSRTASNIGYSNLQHLVDFGPMIVDNTFWHNLDYPLSMKFKTVRYSGKTWEGLKGTVIREYSSLETPNYIDNEIYDFKIRQTLPSEGREGQYRIDFRLKDSLRRFQMDTLNRAVLEGTLYVSAKHHRMLSFEGKLSNITMDAGVDFHTESTRADADVRIMYTHERGFTEVESVVSEMTAGNLKSRSIIYNMYKQPLPFKETRKLEQNLAKVINAAGYDSTMWNTDVVRRTVEEQQLAWFANLNDEEQQEWLLTHVDTAFVSSGPFRPLVSRLDKFAQTIPQEKVYIHMDNTSYMLGDTIWFKAYTRQTSTDKPSTVSGVLYAELWNHDGYMMERKQIEMKDGSGHGFFALGRDQLYAGFYELRAYTRWQLNWGLFEHKHSRVAGKWFPNDEFEQRFYRDYDKLYSRTFPVYDAPFAPGDFDHTMTLRAPRRDYKEDADKRKLVLSLFPEGGTLVKGVPCRVAYEAAWDDGQWVEGQLFVDRDSFPAVNRGRGTFVYTPSDAVPSILFRTAGGEEVTAKLPDAELQGVSLQVIRNGSEWHILTNTTGNVNPADLAMTVTLQGHVERVHRSVGTPLIIPVEDLRAGVYQVTVFNTEGRVFADRLFFSYRPTDVVPTLRVSGVREHYKPYEPIKLTLEGKPEASDISLAVRDANRLDTPFDNGNILTEMLLASEIKGFVPNPGFYFEAYDEAHLQALDLLMMTQGWRRFEWRHMAVRGTWDLTQPDEKAPILIGKVYPYDTFRYRYASQSTNHVDYLYNKTPTKIPQEVTVHTELLPFVQAGEKDTVYVEGVYTFEKQTQNGMFRLQLPRMYNRALLYLDASDTTKWTPDNKYTWVQGMMDDWDYSRIESLTDRRKFYVAPPEFYVTVDFPYPRFTKPYTFHQTHLLNAGGGFDSFANTLLSDGSTQMKQVTVKTTRSILRKFDDAYPILMMDAYEAHNQAHDAGVDFVRTLVSDYGLEYPYAHYEHRTSDHISTHYGMEEWRREQKGMSNHPDSIYLRSQLLSHRQNYADRYAPWMKHRLTASSHLDKIVFYSDYAPRLEGSRRYWGVNLPETDVVMYTFPNGTRRPIYRNRRFVLPGFAACGEFYNPDYSKRKPNTDEADYRRTLYWNPNVRLDKNGRAEVKFYNNTRTTQISVDAAGQSVSGALLWNK